MMGNLAGLSLEEAMANLADANVVLERLTPPRGADGPGHWRVVRAVCDAGPICLQVALFQDDVLADTQKQNTKEPG